MSAWIEVSALRVPCSLLGFSGNAWDFCDAHEGVPEFDGGEYPCLRFPHFEPSPTIENFLDYVLSEAVSEKRESFGFCRELTLKERQEYLPAFLKFFPNLDTSEIRFVHYRYYNGCEAPGYYEFD